MKKILFFIMLTMIVVACNSKEERLNKQLKTTIADYMQQNIKGFTVDSVIFLGKVDSLNAVDYAFLCKQVYQNYKEQIESNILFYIEPETPDERVDQFELMEQYEMVKAKIMSCDSMMLCDQTDTTALYCYFVAARVCGKFSGESQQMEVGFPISTDFQVQEIKFE
ncbi:MAG: hypothetical protein IKS33_02620 [Bacteroidales bacterium]|nr:hypothetical protein [Bacteroidales bacterium]MBO7508188.1 hypothetical protein [Clostridia bacterium]MBO7346591.1 hypothetical protein [Bacteroidales bacterium]MBQ4478308.1 hypothetical protein [Bacteroidales bacterium]MBR4453136.1 hypothetical protein [Bacteroidales bacterium]